MIIDKSSAIRQAKEILNARRLRATAAADANWQIMMKNYSFKKNHERISSLAWDIARAEYKKEDTSTLQAEYDKLQKENEKIITSLGFTPEDFKPKYACKKCADTGIYKDKDCSCFNKILSEILLKESGVDKRNTFKSANTEIWGKENHVNETLYQKMQTYSSDLSKTSKKLVTISGHPGVGKTFLAQCMINESVSHGYFALFMSAFDLNQEFLRYHCAGLSEKDEILEPLLSCDLLVIDDLGTENILKNVTREYLYLVLTERLAKGKNTVITTNFNVEQIDKVYGERISSRITDKRNAAIMEMQGSDLRHKA